MGVIEPWCIRALSFLTDDLMILIISFLQYTGLLYASSHCGADSGDSEMVTFVTVALFYDVSS